VAGKFKLNDKDYRVVTTEDRLWSKKMKSYLNNALVEKGHRGVLNCLGVANQSIINSPKFARKKQNGMCACV
jgi:hypothetical protein